VTTRLGLGGPGTSYGTFTPKAASLTVTPAVRITRLALGGPGAKYGEFSAKADAGGVAAGTFEFLTIARRRGRR
jgi:hypothetical protein